MRFSAGTRMRSDAATGRSPFTSTRGPEQNRNYFLGAYGTLIPNKSSFNLFAIVNDSFETPNINVALGGRTRSEPLSIRSPRDNFNVNGQVDYALTLDQTLRIGFNADRTDNRNLGIGAFDEETRAFPPNEGRRRSVPSNGATRPPRLHTHARRGRLDRLGIAIGRRDADDPSERCLHQGRRTNCGRSALAHRRRWIGPRLRARHPYDSGWPPVGCDAVEVRRYQQLSRNLYLREPRRVPRRPPAQLYAAHWRPGHPLRQHPGRDLPAGRCPRPAEPHVERRPALRSAKPFTRSNNLAPRVGATWALFAGGQTTLRSSWGLFYDWMPTRPYEKPFVSTDPQRELDIINRELSHPVRGRRCRAAGESVSLDRRAGATTVEALQPWDRSTRVAADERHGVL